MVFRFKKLYRSSKEPISSFISTLNPLICYFAWAFWRENIEENVGFQLYLKPPCFCLIYLYAAIFCEWNFYEASSSHSWKVILLYLQGAFYLSHRCWRSYSVSFMEKYVIANYDWFFSNATLCFYSSISLLKVINAFPLLGYKALFCYFHENSSWLVVFLP